VRSIGGKKKTRKWEISGMGKWRSWTNRGMREILLLVELDVNPTWISRKGEAEKKFFFGGYQTWKELNISKCISKCIKPQRTPSISGNRQKLTVR